MQTPCLSVQAGDGEMHTQGIEPWSQAWKACMMPLHYVCRCNCQREALVPGAAAVDDRAAGAIGNLQGDLEQRPPSSVGRAQGS